MRCERAEWNNGRDTLCVDDRTSPHQNVVVRGRLVAIMIALAVLALAEIRHDRQAPAAPDQGSAAATRLMDLPGPAPEAPAIITAAVNASATVQTILFVESRRELNPALTVSTASPHLTVVTFSAGKPRSFPLLI